MPAAMRLRRIVDDTLARMCSWSNLDAGPILTRPCNEDRRSARRFLAAYRVGLSVRSTFDRLLPFEGLRSMATLGRIKSLAIWNTDCGPPHFWYEWNSHAVFVQFALRP